LGRRWAPRLRESVAATLRLNSIGVRLCKFVALQYCHPTAEVFAVAVKLSGAARA
jgi:hypothetical protein